MRVLFAWLCGLGFLGRGAFSAVTVPFITHKWLYHGWHQAAFFFFSPPRQNTPTHRHTHRQWMIGSAVQCSRMAALHPWRQNIKDWLVFTPWLFCWIKALQLFFYLFVFYSSPRVYWFLNHPVDSKNSLQKNNNNNNNQTQTNTEAIQGFFFLQRGFSGTNRRRTVQQQKQIKTLLISLLQDLNIHLSREECSFLGLCITISECVCVSCVDSSLWSEPG